MLHSLTATFVNRGTENTGAHKLELEGHDMMSTGFASSVPDDVLLFKPGQFVEKRVLRVLNMIEDETKEVVSVNYLIQEKDIHLWYIVFRDKKIAGPKFGGGPG